MSYDTPHPAILNRDLAVAEVKELTEAACSLIREIVNHATHALVRCNASNSDAPDEDHATLALHRHVIEMADGIEILLAASAPVAALPLLRSQFEGWLSLKFILADSDHYSRRCLSWLATYAAKRLEGYEKLAPGTKAHEDFKATLQSDVHAHAIHLPDDAVVASAIENMRDLLAKPHLAPYSAEYHRLRKGNTRVNWFQLFGGPATLAKLARQLGYAAIYSELYGYWSRVSHATDFSRYLVQTPAGGAAIGRLRLPHTIPSVATLAISNLVDTTRIMLVKHRSGEEGAFKRWYLAEVRESFHRLMNWQVVDATPG